MGTNDTGQWADDFVSNLTWSNQALYNLPPSSATYTPPPAVEYPSVFNAPPSITAPPVSVSAPSVSGYQISPYTAPSLFPATTNLSQISPFPSFSATSPFSLTQQMFAQPATQQEQVPFIGSQEVLPGIELPGPETTAAERLQATQAAAPTMSSQIVGAPLARVAGPLTGEQLQAAAPILNLQQLKATGDTYVARSNVVDIASTTNKLAATGAPDNLQSNIISAVANSSVPDIGAKQNVPVLGRTIELKELFTNTRDNIRSTAPTLVDWGLRSDMTAEELIKYHEIPFTSSGLYKDLQPLLANKYVEKNVELELKQNGSISNARILTLKEEGFAYGKTVADSVAQLGHGIYEQSLKAGHYNVTAQREALNKIEQAVYDSQVPISASSPISQAISGVAPSSAAALGVAGAAAPSVAGAAPTTPPPPKKDPIPPGTQETLRTKYFTGVSTMLPSKVDEAYTKAVEEWKKYDSSTPIPSRESFVADQVQSELAGNITSIQQAAVKGGYESISEARSQLERRVEVDYPGLDTRQKRLLVDSGLDAIRSQTMQDYKSDILGTKGSIDDFIKTATPDELASKSKKASLRLEMITDPQLKQMFRPIAIQLQMAADNPMEAATSDAMVDRAWEVRKPNPASFKGNYGTHAVHTESDASFLRNLKLNVAQRSPKPSDMASTQEYIQKAIESHNQEELAKSMAEEQGFLFNSNKYTGEPTGTNVGNLLAILSAGIGAYGTLFAQPKSNKDYLKWQEEQARRSEEFQMRYLMASMGGRGGGGGGGGEPSRRTPSAVPGINF